MVNLFKIKNSKWSETKKKTLWIIIGILTVLYFASSFLNVKLILFNNQDKNLNITQIIADELLTLNKSLGPSMCGFIAERIVYISNAFGNDPLLVFSIIKWESWGDPLAKNKDTGAMGLMAVLHTEKERKKWKDWELCDIDANLTNGNKKLKEKKDKLIPYKKFPTLPDIVVILLRYNGIIKDFYSPGEGFEYVSKVLGERDKLQEKLDKNMCKYYDLVHKEEKNGTEDK